MATASSRTRTTPAFVREKIWQHASIVLGYAACRGRTPNYIDATGNQAMYTYSRFDFNHRTQWWTQVGVRTLKGEILRWIAQKATSWPRTSLKFPTNESDATLRKVRDDNRNPELFESRGGTPKSTEAEKRYTAARIIIISDMAYDLNQARAKLARTDEAIVSGWNMFYAAPYENMRPCQ
ncbi:MAG: hypothetical protein LQ338_004776 [Usnochroma carphineum]|nr:MAG: hypothetical protein LQ338_004776 [Usnochroma carphineum]